MAAANDTKGIDSKATQNGQDGSTRSAAKKKKYGLFSIMLPILLALSIILGIWGYFIKANKFGLGEILRQDLKNIPIVNMVLPPSPDPEAAEYLSYNQLVQKYDEYRQKAKDLNAQIEKQKLTITDLQKYKNNEQEMRGEVSRQKASNEAESKRIAEENKQLKADKLKFAEDVKNADPEGFVQYFEKMDKDIAAQIYEKVMREKMVDKETQNFVKTFDSMEPASAAQVLEHMGMANMDLVANIMKLMKKQVSAEVLANMDPVFAANLADRMAVEYPIYPEE